MNTDELQEKLNSLIAPMLGKGLVSPTAKAIFDANSHGGISLAWKWRETQPHEPWDDRVYANKWFYAGTRDDGCEPWAGALYDAMLEIMGMPEKADRQRDEFLKLLATATEYGRKVGIDEEFVNPLAILAKKLSENALTGPESVERIVLNVSPEARAGLDSPIMPMTSPRLTDDDIPF